MDVYIHVAAILMHSTDIYGYYVTPETPIVPSVKADCADSVPPPNILEKSAPMLVLQFTGHCNVPQFLLHIKILFSVQM